MFSVQPYAARFLSCLYHAHPPELGVDGWYHRIEGLRVLVRGPFASEIVAEADQFRRLQAFAAAARRRGGWLSVLTRREWLVTLPEGVPCGGLPFHRAPMSRGTDRSPAK